MKDAEDVFRAKTISLYHFLGRQDLGLIIPTYQRPYSWKKEHVFDLIDDVVAGLEDMMKTRADDAFTYIGTVITTDGSEISRATGSSHPPSQLLEVVDGQQRISTITIISLALLVNLIEQLDKISRAREVTKGVSGELDKVLRILKFVSGHLEDILLGKKHGFNETNKYVRLIRADHDQWLTQGTQTRSPLAFMVGRYQQARETNIRFTTQTPPDWDGTNHEQQRFKEVLAAIGDFYIQDDPSSSAFGGLPTFVEISGAENIQKQLLPNLSFPEGNFGVDETREKEIKDAVRLATFTSYFLNRVAFTNVKGEDENFAFEVFQSLNTTGEPLNAYETFKPKVIRAIDQQRYPISPEAALFQSIDKTLARPNTQDKKRRLVTESIIYFALANDGKRVGKNLGLQTKYFRDSFKRQKLESKAIERRDYLQLFSTTCEVTYVFMDGTLQNYGGLVSILSSDEDAKTCFKFLSDIRHTIVLPLIAIFYNACRDRQHFPDQEKLVTRADIRSLIKALTAFSVLWRAAFGGTNGIDAIYRAITERYASVPQNKLSISTLKADLLNILETRETRKGGPLANFELWIELAVRSEIYTQEKLSKLLLLIAHHDTIPDSASPGLVKQGTRNCSPGFSIANYMEVELEVEHVAPQSAITAGAWPEDVRSDRKARNYIGNLVLVPKLANVGLGNRSWLEKRKIFQALSNTNPEERARVLKEAGFHLTDRIKEILNDSTHVPGVASIAKYDGEWNQLMIDKRGRRLLDLCHTKLRKWIA